MISRNKFIYMFKNDIIRLKYGYVYSTKYCIYKYVGGKVVFDRYLRNGDVLEVSNCPSNGSVSDLYTCLVYGMVDISIMPVGNHKSKRCI